MIGVIVKDVIINFYLQNSLIINIIFILFVIIGSVFMYLFRNKLNEIYIKNKEIVNYIIVGALTTVVSIGSYWLFRFIIKNYLALSIISWIMAVSFAYFANRIFVFESKKKEVLEEIIKFVSCRLLTLGI